MSSGSKALGAAGGDGLNQAMLSWALAGDQTRGLDVDSFYQRKDGRWVLIELCRCKTVPPWKSHPNYYWFNWKKWVGLWNLKNALDAEFFVVNWNDDYSDFKVMRVLDIRPGLVKEGGGMDAEETVMTPEEFRAWYRALNANALQL